MDGVSGGKESYLGQLERLRPEDGDLLVLRYSQGTLNAELRAELQTALRDAMVSSGVSNPVVMLPVGFELESWHWGDDGRLSRHEPESIVAAEAATCVEVGGCVWEDDILVPLATVDPLAQLPVGLRVVASLSMGLDASDTDTVSDLDVEQLPV